jgi:CheY-like chemotaxis protein
MADPRRLKQIFVNLLSNAVKFTPEKGHITLDVDGDREQDIIRFSVIDTGIGISDRDLKRLFQPFVQVDSSLNRQYQGTGLGLALVQKLTDLHGGSVEVDSKIGEGSRFTVNLIINQAEIAKLAGPTKILSMQNRESVRHIDAPLPHDIHRGLILLVDDNPPNIMTVGEYLQSYGHQVFTAHDGFEAINKAQEIHPDVILMDIQMPVMNGLEAISRLRSDPDFAYTPIIALTALAMPGDRERCLQVGADEYLSKPVSLKLLVKTIQAMIDQNKGRS